MNQEHLLDIEGFTLDVSREKLTYLGITIKFSLIETNILKILFSRPFEYLSRDELFQKLHGREWRFGERGIDVLISRIRKKIRDAGINDTVIHSGYHSGYKFCAPEIKPDPCTHCGR